MAVFDDDYIKGIVREVIQEAVGKHLSANPQTITGGDFEQSIRGDYNMQTVLTRVVKTVIASNIPMYPSPSDNDLSSF